jgi:histidinol-phosphatase (PHP family)
VNPQPWIIERYLSFGGKYITVGSDAHGKNEIGAGFKEALNILNTLDMKEIFYCENGNFIPLNVNSMCRT